MEKPSAKDFSDRVERVLKRDEITDCIYERSVKEFNKIRLSELKDADKERILWSFLFLWGKCKEY